MWSSESSEPHKPRGGSYPSGLTGADWAQIVPLISPPRLGGPPRQTHMREAMNAIRYALRTGFQWREPPKDFPPRSTVYNYFRK